MAFLGLVQGGVQSICEFIYSAHAQIVGGCGLDRGTCCGTQSLDQL